MQPSSKLHNLHFGAGPISLTNLAAGYPLCKPLQKCMVPVEIKCVMKYRTGTIYYLLVTVNKTMREALENR